MALKSNLKLPMARCDPLEQKLCWLEVMPGSRLVVTRTTGRGSVRLSKECDR